MNAPLIHDLCQARGRLRTRGDEFCKRCNCRKRLRWTQNGVQYRRKAGTRSWGEAEEQKRRLEDELACCGPCSGKSSPFRRMSAWIG